MRRTNKKPRKKVFHKRNCTVIVIPKRKKSRFKPRRRW